MVSLALIVIVVVAVVLLVVLGSSRARSTPRAVGPAAPVEGRSPAIQRWVAAGLISSDQARAIATYEQERVAGRPERRVSPAIEALAYVGGVLVAVGAGMLVAQFWHRLGAGGHIATLAVGAVVTGLAGTFVGESDSVTWRLRAFLWALSAGAIAAVAAIFVVDVVDVRGEPVALAAAGAGALSSAGYWWLRNRPLQHALTFVGLAVSISVAIIWAGGTGSHGGLIGLALWVLGCLWAGLAWQRRLPPATVGFLLGAALTLIASGIIGTQFAWVAPLLGLATAAALVGLGVALNEPLVLAPGVVGVFAFLPWTLGYYFGGTLGAPTVAMLSGAMLLAVVVLLLRRGRGHGGAAGGTWGGHFHPIAHA